MTAVEWLYNYLFPKQLDGFSDEEWDKIDKAFDQAKQMEKEQIEEICLSVIEQILDNLEKGEEVESEIIFKKHLERYK